MTTLSVWTPHDGVLACVAPLGLAASAGTALVVDLDPSGPSYPGTVSLADLVAHGPRRSDLSPQRPGMAVLRNGGITVEAADEVVSALAEGWPNLVLRLPTGRPHPDRSGVVPVVPLFPGSLHVAWDAPAVRQPTGLAVSPRAPGVTLPRLGRSLLGSLLRGTSRPKSRWIRAWKSVWEMPW